MSSRLRDERGQVIVLAAVMIPVFLLMTALVLDAGNWFTHKRQLQNRADAAALAAGYELAQRWPACVGDPVSESAITDVAKHFGGALENGGVADDPTAVNNEVVDNSKFDIAVNSTSYDPGTDNTDGHKGTVGIDGTGGAGHPLGAHGLTGPRRPGRPRQP